MQETVSDEAAAKPKRAICDFQRGAGMGDHR